MYPFRLHLSLALVEIHVVRHLRNVPVLSAWETFMADRCQGM